MEYVKDAIEKARKERKREHDFEGASAAISTDATRVDQQAPDSRAISIDYSKTRKRHLSMRTLMENRVVAAFENDKRSEPYRQLRTQVLRKFRENNWRTLAITSAHSGAGKTLTSVNLAVALAKDVNQTVLLADMDFKGPNILDVLGLETDVGFVEILERDLSLQDVLVNPGMDRLTVLPALPITGATSEILSSPRMKSTLDEIINRYPDRLVIFDLPPLLEDDDALVFMPYVDASLLIVENGVTTPEEMARCVNLLEGTNILGTIFNKAK